MVCQFPDDLTELALVDALVMEKAVDGAVRRGEWVLIILIEFLPGGLLDGDVAAIAIEDRQAQGDPEASGIDGGGIAAMREAEIEGGKLPQDRDTVALILGVVAVLQGDEIRTTAREFGQQGKHAFCIQGR